MKIKCSMSRVFWGLIILVSQMAFVPASTPGLEAQPVATGRTPQQVVRRALLSDHTVIATTSPKQNQINSTVTILTESFEGNFPQDNNWFLNDASSSDGGEYLWGPVTKRYHTGTRSVWVAAGGANGTGLAGGTSYYNNMDTAMRYGPFDLSDATAATMTFYYWQDTNTSFSNQDALLVGASQYPDKEFAGNQYPTDTNGWVSDTVDFSNVDGSKTSLLGKSQVYVLFDFVSDASTTREGVYIDDIVIQKTIASDSSSHVYLPYCIR